MITTRTSRPSFAKIIKMSVLALVVATAPYLMAGQASAAQITARKVTLGSSVASATTSYTFDFTVPTTASIGSIKFEFCAQASGTCTSSAATTGVVSGATLGTQSGASGFTLGANTSNSSYITRTAAAITGGTPLSYQLNGIVNPSNPSATTFFIRITTYTGTNGSTGLTDSGTVAASTAVQIQVALTVDETLTFCTGTSITGTNCGTATGSAVTLPTASTTVTSSGTSILAASTNGSSGYSVTVSGNTLTSGANTIDALPTGDTSSVGIEQYGLNLVSNATPSVGSAVSGTGTATASGNYAIANTFRFNPASSETIAAVGGPSNANTFTVSYIANIAGLTQPGIYTSNLTYIATANF